MSEPFLGEIKVISFNYAPKGWAFCNGQLLPINQNQALFSLLGTMYGGDGRVNFALPNLQGRVPIHLGAGFVQGQQAGQEAHTLTISEMPSHAHLLQASTTLGNDTVSAGNLLANPRGPIYTDFGNVTNLLPSSVTNFGGGQSHTNMQPYLVLNFIIALQGIFPSRN